MKFPRAGQVPAPVAAVTGASSGLGALFARRLGERGFDLVLTGRDQARLSEVRRRVLYSAPERQVALVIADLASEEGLAAVLSALERSPASLLVNNAGFGTYGPFSESDPAREASLIGVNVTALVRLTRAVLPGMLERGDGGVLNVASAIAFVPAPYQATYGAAKAFVLSFSQALWEEARGGGVTVTALCPGPVKTGFTDALGNPRALRSSLYARLAEPGPVVDAGLRALSRGAPVAVPGLRSQAGALAARVTPRRLVTAMSGRLAAPEGGWR